MGKWLMCSSPETGCIRDKGRIEEPVFTGPEEGQEAAVLGQGVITGIGITGREAIVKVGLEVIGSITVAGTGIIIIEAGAGLMKGASPARRSPSTRRSLFPIKTPPSRDESCDVHNHKERSTTPKSVSLHGRHDCRSLSPRSEGDE